MQGGNEAQIRSQLTAEITNLQELYKTLTGYLKGEPHGDPEIMVTFKKFNDSLSLASTHILALYQLRGRKTKLGWDLLFTNLDTALVTLQNSAHPKPQATIQAAFNISQPPIGEIMEYLAALKQSIR